MAGIMNRLMDRLSPKIEAPADEAIAFDLLCGATKSPFTAELVKVGPGYLFRRFVSPEAPVRAFGWLSDASRNAPARPLVQAINISRINLSGEFCPHCKTSLDQVTRCGRCGTMVCRSAVSKHRSPQGNIVEWFACPCGSEGWITPGDAGGLLTVTGRKCAPIADDRAGKSPALPSRLNVPRLPAPRAANGLLQLPPPAKGRS